VLTSKKSIGGKRRRQVEPVPIDNRLVPLLIGDVVKTRKNDREIRESNPSSPTILTRQEPMSRIIRRSDPVAQIERHAERRSEPEPSPRLWAGTGSTLLNLALSDRADGGFLVGKVVNIVGDQSSGKTFLALTILAEAAHNPRFDKYQLIHDDAEAASEFDFAKLFGQKTAERVLPPSLRREEPGYSQTVLDFECSVKSVMEEGPTIYVLDSLDALTTDADIKHGEELREAHDKGREAKGSYGMEKAKQASILLRHLVAKARDSGSLVIIISQTRDNIDPMSFQRKTRAGGKALYFYCSYEMWLAVAGKISAKINDKPRVIGVTSRIKCTKNKATGKLREVDLPIYYSYGLDDVGSCVDFLVGEGHWPKGGSGTITAPELNLSGVRSKLIREIEESSKHGLLSATVQKVWLDIEAKMVLPRNPKYERE